MTDPTIPPNQQDAIDALFRQAAARDQLNQVLEGKTADERRDILILLLCRSVGELALQNEALALKNAELTRLLGRITDIISAQNERIGELELKVMVVISATKKTRGPFLRRILNQDG